MKLQLNYCTYKISRYAVEHWHYSRHMPSGKLIRIGAWEDDQFVGVVIFGRGASGNIGKPYGLTQMEICELVRVAFREHTNPITQVLSACIKKLKADNPGLRLIVSYADSNQGHLGIIYQAGNWIYTGESKSDAVEVNGRQRHRRTLNAVYGTSDIKWLQQHVDKRAKILRMPAKYKYLYPLDRWMRKQIEPLRKPYPKANQAA